MKLNFESQCSPPGAKIGEAVISDTYFGKIFTPLEGHILGMKTETDEECEIYIGDEAVRQAGIKLAVFEEALLASTPEEMIEADAI